MKFELGGIWSTTRQGRNLIMIEILFRKYSSKVEFRLFICLTWKDMVGLFGPVIKGLVILHANFQCVRMGVVCSRLI